MAQNKKQMISIKAVEQIFERMCVEDPRIRMFRIADVWQQNTVTNEFPLVMFEVLDSGISVFDRSGKRNTYNVRISCLDQRLQDWSNVTDVLSNTHIILNDLFLRFTGERAIQSLGITFESKNFPIKPALWKNNDIFIGNYIDISFSSPSLICLDDLPTTPLGTINTSCYSCGGTTGEHALTCSTLAACPTIVDIYAQIAALSASTSTFECNDLLTCNLFLNLSGQTEQNTIDIVALSAATSTATYVQDGVNTYTGGTASAPTVNVVDSPSFISLSATTFYSGSTELSTLFFSNPAQGRTLYVAKNGNNTDGSTYRNAFTSISAATAYYTSTYNDASATKPFTIEVIDTDSYNLGTSLTIPNYVAINCSKSDLYGKVILGDGSKLWVKTHYANSNSGTLVTKQGITTTSYYKADVLDTRGSGGTNSLINAVTSTGSTGQVFLDIKKMYVVKIGVGSGGGTDNGHIHLNIEDLYLANNGAIGIRSEGASTTSIVGYVHHIIEAGAFTNTYAFELAGGRISIISTEIVCDNLSYIVDGANSKFNLVCPYISVSSFFNTDIGAEFHIDDLTKNIISSTAPSYFYAGVNVNSLSATTYYSGTTELGSLFSTPSLQQVTDIGNTTDNNIIIATDGSGGVNRRIVFKETNVGLSGASDFYIGQTTAGAGILGEITYPTRGIAYRSGAAVSNDLSALNGNHKFNHFLPNNGEVGIDFYAGASFTSATISIMGSVPLQTGTAKFVNDIAVDSTLSFPINSGRIAIQSEVLALTGGTLSGGVFAPSVSATTFYSGATELSTLFGGGAATYVQNGTNTTTGGTPSRPTINVVASPSFTDVTATNFISGATNLNALFAPIGSIAAPTYVQNGNNITTGGTPSRPTVNLVASPSVNQLSVSGSVFDNSANAVSGVYFKNSSSIISTTNQFTYDSGDFALELSNADSKIYLNGANAFLTINGANGYIDAAQIRSGGTDLSLLIGGTPTYVQPGSNIITGGTPSRPTVNLVDSPSLLNLTVSGNTSLYTTDVNGFANFYAGAQFIAAGSILFDNGLTSNEQLIMGPNAYIQSEGIYDHYQVFSPEVSGTSISATTYFSGSTPLNTILAGLGGGVPTYVQNGNNTTTGGTPSRPTVNLVPSPSVDGLIFSGDITDNNPSNAELGIYFKSATGKIINNAGLSFDPDTTLLSYNIDGASFEMLNADSVFNITSGTVNAKNIRAASISGTSISATTFYSGNTDLSTLLGGGAPTYVQGGLNTFTGGTPSRPTVNLAGTIVITAITVSSFISDTIASNRNDGVYFKQGDLVISRNTFTYDGTTVTITPPAGGLRAVGGISGGTFYSGTTELSTLIPAPTYVQNGTNITTGGTPSRPTVNVSATPSFTSVQAVTLSGGTIFSGNTDLSTILAGLGGGVPTYVQNGVNTTTGGTITRPTVDVVASPSFTTVSATTFVSGSTNLQSIIEQSNTDEFFEVYRALGSDQVAHTFGAHLSYANTATALTDGQIRTFPVYFHRNTTVSGATIYTRVQGNFTGDNFNGIGLYSYDGAGTLTQVAVTSNNQNHWKGTANAFLKIDFSATTAVNKGLYFLALLYNQSAATTAPSIATIANLNNAAMASAALMTNSAKLYGTIAGQTTLPSSIAFSSVTASNVVPWMGVYES